MNLSDKEMRVLPSNVIVRVDSEYKTKLRYGSLELDIPENFAPFNKNRKNFAQISGEIICAPERLVGGGEVKVEVGDKAYWHFNSIKDSTRLDWMNEKIHQILYDHLFCKVTDAGEIVMLNRRVLLEPIYDQDVDSQGFVKKGGLIVGTSTEKWNDKKAIMRHVDPDNEYGLKDGDIVWYEKHADFINEIEGVEYFVCFEDDIMFIES